jgi:hypothetical protein
MVYALDQLFNKEISYTRWFQLHKSVNAPHLEMCKKITCSSNHLSKVIQHIHELFPFNIIGTRNSKVSSNSEMGIAILNWKENWRHIFLQYLTVALPIFLMQTHCTEKGLKLKYKYNSREYFVYIISHFWEYSHI